MIRVRLEQLRQDWAQNRRLRFGVLVVVIIAGLHGVARLADQREAEAAAFQREGDLLRRLQAAGQEKDWPKRAKDAEASLAGLVESIPMARSAGAAQADLQTRLRTLAADAVLTGPTVRVETTVDVPDHPDLLQVMARLEGTVPTPHDLAPVLRALSAGLPWLQTEQLEVGEGAPVRIMAIVRAYYRKPASTVMAGDATAATPAPAATTKAAGVEGPGGTSAEVRP